MTRDGDRMARVRRAPRPAPAALVTPPYPYVPLTLETLRDDHAIQRLLCDELEMVADGLPDLPPPAAIRRLCDRILWISTTHFVRAEAILRTLPPGRAPARAALEALYRMHRLDEVHAQDLVEQLWRLDAVRARGAADNPARRPSMEGGLPDGGGMGEGIGQLAYMLRCFFDGARRAMALKESWIAASGRPAATQGAAAQRG